MKRVYALKKRAARRKSTKSSGENTLRILFVASEGLPFSKTGGLADVIEALPKALVAQGHRVAVVLPRYRGTECKKIVLRGLKVRIGKTVRAPVIAEGPQLHGVQYFFVDDPE